jgi:hypothetical protein
MSLKILSCVQIGERERRASDIRHAHLISSGRANAPTVDPAPVGSPNATIFRPSCSANIRHRPVRQHCRAAGAQVLEACVLVDGGPVGRTTKPVVVLDGANRCRFPGSSSARVADRSGLAARSTPGQAAVKWIAPLGIAFTRSSRASCDGCQAIHRCGFVWHQVK